MEHFSSEIAAWFPLLYTFITPDARMYIHSRTIPLAATTKSQKVGNHFASGLKFSQIHLRMHLVLPKHSNCFLRPSQGPTHRKCTLFGQLSVKHLLSVDKAESYNMQLAQIHRNEWTKYFDLGYAWWHVEDGEGWSVTQLPPNSSLNHQPKQLTINADETEQLADARCWGKNFPTVCGSKFCSTLKDQDKHKHLKEQLVHQKIQLSYQFENTPATGTFQISLTSFPKPNQLPLYTSINSHTCTSTATQLVPTSKMNATNQEENGFQFSKIHLQWKKFEQRS